MGEPSTNNHHCNREKIRNERHNAHISTRVTSLVALTISTTKQ